MGIKNLNNGLIQYSYDLYVKPCPECAGTNILLYENGKGKKSFEGGGMCKDCGHTIEIKKVPDVPSMNMLLDIWNNQ